MKKNILLFLFFVAGLTLHSCKDWMDINYTPNDASANSVSTDLLLTAAQYDMTDILTNSTNSQMLSQHLTKSGEVSGIYTFLTGLIMPQDIDSWWDTYYKTNTNLKLIEEKALATNNPAYQGIAIVLSVCNYQRLVDIFGNIPYTQALQPKEFVSPAYDKAEDIYANLLIRVDEAITALEAATTSTTIDLAALKKSDIMCKGNLKTWIKFAYSQKLRLLMRMSNSKENEVKAALTAITDKCMDINENITVQPGFYVQTDKMNIFYQNFGYNNLGGELNYHRYYMPTNAVIDMLRDNNDPRLRVYADPRPRLGTPTDGSADYTKYGLNNEYFIGIPYGQMSPPRYYYTCKIGLGVLAGCSNKTTGAQAPTTFMAGAEVGFFLAEAALRNLIPGGDAKAKEYYEAAVTSAMKRHEIALQDKGFTAQGVPAPINGTATIAAKDFLSQDNDFVNWNKMATNDRKVEAICAQKWLSLFGYNPLEAWFEQRRTDLPKLQSSMSGQENKIICKLPYPQSERNLNAANVDAQGEVNVYTSLVFWDLKNELVPRATPYL